MSPIEPPDRRPRRLDALISGRVQGVGYRYFVVERARRLRVTGWVANEPDGSVRCLAEGNEAALRELLGALWHGPGGAHVAAVSDAWSAGTGEFARFDVRSVGHRGD